MTDEWLYQIIRLKMSTHLLGDSINLQFVFLLSNIDNYLDLNEYEKSFIVLPLFDIWHYVGVRHT